MTQQPPLGQGLLIVKDSRPQTNQSREDSSGRVISPMQRPLPDNSQHSEETDIHAFGGIPTPQSHQASFRRPTP